jgi:hypothetical protein
MGGHNGQWSNKVVSIDLSANAPTWVLQYRGSEYSSVPTYQQMDSGKLDYYLDGLPTSRHTYYANQYIGKRNRIMMFYDGAAYGGGSHISAAVDGYRIGDKRYDPAGTWAKSSIYTSSGANSFVPTAAKHPVTEDVYLGNNGIFQKWTQATGTWSSIPIYNPPGWEFHGSVIDATRNRWVYCDSGVLQFIDLNTWVVSTLPVTGVANFADIASQAYNTILHDLDNDRYLLIVGNSYNGPDGQPPYPGRVYGINPTTGAATLVASIPAAFNGVNNRATYFQSLGGVAYLPAYDSNILFMPTR